MSTFYPRQNISTCQIAGAIALAILHDLKINLFTFPGFPQITVTETSTTHFNITLTWYQSANTLTSIDFEINKRTAFSAGRLFQSKNIHDKRIFKSIQSAISKLERNIKADQN